MMFQMVKRNTFHHFLPISISSQHVKRWLWLLDRFIAILIFFLSFQNALIKVQVKEQNIFVVVPDKKMELIKILKDILARNLICFCDYHH